jgi:MFS transporter, DHA2 family, multidrug resistance protein
MGLVMAPASTIIMETVPADQAGAGSAVNDTVREVGGALGIAVVGSIVAAVYRNHLGPVLSAHHAPSVVVHSATASIAQADGIAKHVGGTVGGELASAAHFAFTTAMSTGMRVAAAVAFVGAFACYVAIPRRPQARSEPLLEESVEVSPIPEPVFAGRTAL